MFVAGCVVALLAVGAAAYAFARWRDRRADARAERAFSDDPDRADTYALLWRWGGLPHVAARLYARRSADLDGAFTADGARTADAAATADGTRDRVGQRGSQRR